MRKPVQVVWGHNASGGFHGFNVGYGGWEAEAVDDGHDLRNEASTEASQVYI